MVKDEEYIELLKSMISCVSRGDYYSIKELSQLKLEKYQKKEQEVQQEMKKIKKMLKKQKKLPFEKWENGRLMQAIELYSYYAVNKSEKELLSFEEFMNYI